MIEKNKDVAHRIYPLHPQRWLQFLFNLLVGYGYRPWRAFIWSLFVIGVGSVLFACGGQAGIMTPTKDNEYLVGNNSSNEMSNVYPKYNPFIYSLEMFTPLLKMNMADYWQPNAYRSGPVTVCGISFAMQGSLLRDYLWFHIIIGWVLTTLWVGGLTGLVKK